MKYFIFALLMLLTVSTTMAGPVTTTCDSTETIECLIDEGVSAEEVKQAAIKADLVTSSTAIYSFTSALDPDSGDWIGIIVFETQEGLLGCSWRKTETITQIIDEWWY